MAEVEQALLARWPESRVAPSLDRVRAAVDLLGRPQTVAPAVHITGTNGKTSTARMVDELLQATGRRTGRCTSPHLSTVRERIVVDGVPVTEDAFVAAHEAVLPAVRQVDDRSPVPMSFFEVVTTMAYVAFARAGVDALVVEVGMGGTWDATNVVDGEVAVVAPISLDHTEHLGPDEAAIAREKAGIIKPGADVVLADQVPAARAVLLDRVRRTGARIRPVVPVRRRPAGRGQLLDVVVAGVLTRVELPLLGGHQADNAALAITAADALLSRHGARLHPEEVRRALSGVRSPGRLEVVAEDPLVVVDASHNPAGMATTVHGLTDALDVDELVVVLAVLAGKDADQVVAALDPVAALLVVTSTDSPRALPAVELEATARRRLGHDRVVRVEGLDAAVDRARAEAARRGRRTGVLVTGSVVTAGRAADLLRG
ncbi:dihydrofolate synthase [Klenkia taihuensis]|uniref:tetrahydrofolate synthase n=2 Tax=Klenkia taihuensis TaxID=1225127 RepID=A0A1I1QW07_9ACTN|nr:dihydrofolate synthase [Klenkia taihuensis]SFD26225.1 dihydrofolate synthase / folylpolyglutamate synthase [Klenkia taihuensis]